MNQKLKNNVAVVTGAASGIGRAIAERLASDGARLVIADLDEAELDKATKHLGKEFGAEVVSHAGDLSSESVAKATIDLAVNHFGRLDVLVNNAGGGIIRAFAEPTPETLRTTIDRNLWTVLSCSWHAVRKCGPTPRPDRQSGADSPGTDLELRRARRGRRPRLDHRHGANSRDGSP